MALPEQNPDIKIKDLVDSFDDGFDENGQLRPDFDPLNNLNIFRRALGATDEQDGDIVLPATKAEADTNVSSLDDAREARRKRAEQGDLVEKKQVLPDVLEVDQERRYTFQELRSRRPFENFSLKVGEMVLSDDIYTIRRREEHLATIRDNNARAQRYGLTSLKRNGGLSAAREQLEEKLVPLDFSDIAIHAAQLALSELCTNTSMHSTNTQDGIAGTFEARYYEERDALVVMAINATARPSQKPGDDPRGVQTKGRGLSLLKELLEPKAKADEVTRLGKLRIYYSVPPNGDHTAATERIYLHRAAGPAGLGRTATWAMIPRTL